MDVGDKLASVAVNGVAPVVGRGLDLGRSFDVLAELVLERTVDIVPPGRKRVNTILAKAEAVNRVSELIQGAERIELTWEG